MKCTDCSYYWKEEDDFFAHCQFDESIHPTPCPCEEGDMYEEDEYDYDEERW